MRVRQSGLSPRGQAQWKTFFAPERLLRAMGLSERDTDVADLGAGYGTFAVPAAARIRGVLHAFDIDERMIGAIRSAARQAGTRNIRLHRRDVISRGTGLADGSMSYVMLFNILHAEDPVSLLREAWRILAPGGRVGVVHWMPDPETPMGPSMDIRPRSADCREWLARVGFVIVKKHVRLPPFHYGVLARKARP